MFRDFFLRLYFKNLYKKYLHQGWPLVCHAPKFLNIALPDFSVVYRLASFQKTDSVQIIGVPPHYYSYYSFYMYDDSGLPIGGISDQNITVVDGVYKLTVGKELPKPSTDYYCIIYRVYYKNFIQEEPPIFLLNGLIVQPTPFSQVSKETLTMASSLTNRLTNRSIQIEDKSPYFIKPPDAKLNALFPNPDSKYMLLFPLSTDDYVLKITGKMPSKIGYNYPLRFVGFMSCNLKTTSTEACISYLELPSSYCIWVAKNKKQAIKAGWKDEKNTFIRWSSDDNAIPLLVYREVRIDNKGLGNKNIKPLEVKSVEKALGKYYPNVEYIKV